MDSRTPVRREEQRASICAKEKLKTSPETPSDTISIAEKRFWEARVGFASGDCC
ncbi:MAG: hypothetical protein AB2L12_03510 [Smithellaceae bacterium]